MLTRALLAVGRVFLGVHSLSDVAVGALLGSAAALLVWAASRRLPAGLGGISA